MPDAVRREQVLAGAVRAGKITPARVDHYRAMYDADPEGTENLIAVLAAGLPVNEIGQAVPPDGLTQVMERRTGQVARPGQIHPHEDEARGTGRIWHARDE